MKNLLLSLFLALPCLLAAQMTVEQQELQRFEAQMHRDTAALKILLADDLVYIHSNAYTENKTQHLHAIASGDIQYLSMERQEAKRRTYGKTAIINGIIHVKGVFKTNPFDVNLRYTAVYRKKHKIWQLCNWQSTRM